MCEMTSMKDIAVIEQHIFSVFQNAHADIMNEPVSSGSALVKDDDEESVWTDYDSAEENEENEEGEEDFADIVMCNCHEILAEPCFAAPRPFDPCAICFEDIKMVNITVTRCGHVFHASCMFEAIAAKSCCPLCRTQLVNDGGDYYEEEDEEDDDEHQEEDEVEDEEEDEVIVSWTIDRTPN